MRKEDNLTDFFAQDFADLSIFEKAVYVVRYALYGAPHLQPEVEITVKGLPLVNKLAITILLELAGRKILTRLEVNELFYRTKPKLIDRELANLASAGSIRIEHNPGNRFKTVIGVGGAV